MEPIQLSTIYLGLVFGLLEIGMLFFVCGCQVLVEKQNMQLPWTKD
jgi:hypothetical protein